MPIKYAIDHAKKLVTAAASDTLTDDEIFGYQRAVWSRSDVTGYDELVDMSAVTRVVPPTAERIRQLAELAAGMDNPESASKFAIVAPQDFEFGLGRMLEAYRSLDPRSTKRVRVFRTMASALTWLREIS